MKVIHGLKNIKGRAPNSVMTIGVFDGVHIAHKQIIKMVVDRARGSGAKSVVVTFDPHPLKVLHTGAYVPSLISLAHRIRLIGELGVDYLVVVNFTRTIAGMPPEKFVKDILIDKLSLEEICVGENFYFGKGAAAGVKPLVRLSKKMGFEVNVIKPVKTDGQIISSSLIRRLISKGDITRASRFLGRPVVILGTVKRGSQRGRILGFPTANINPHHETIPPSGVYAVKVWYRKRAFNGVLNIGTRPTFQKGPGPDEPTIEVHIFSFSKKIYGEDVEIVFVKKIRNEKKFRSRTGLISQIKGDIKTARQILI